MRRSRMRCDPADPLLRLLQWHGIAYATAGEGRPLVKAANWLTHLDTEWSIPIWGHWIAPEG